MTTVYLIICAAVSVVTIIVFAMDKIASMKENKTRTPESVLLSLIALGGAPGGLIGMYLFRHKTVFSEKFQFAIGVWAAFVIQVALAVVIALIQSGTVSI